MPSDLRAPRAAWKKGTLYAGSQACCITTRGKGADDLA